MNNWKFDIIELFNIIMRYMFIILTYYFLLILVLFRTLILLELQMLFFTSFMPFLNLIVSNRITGTAVLKSDYMNTAFNRSVLFS